MPWRLSETSHPLVGTFSQAMVKVAHRRPAVRPACRDPGSHQSHLVLECGRGSPACRRIEMIAEGAVLSEGFKSTPYW